MCFQVLTLFIMGGRRRSYRTEGLLATAIYISVNDSMWKLLATRSMTVLLALALGGLCAGCRKKPAPSIDGIAAALQRTADQTLAAPSLASEQVTISVKPGQAGAEATEALQEASAAGGVGIQSSTADGGISILATVPENNAEAFKAALRHEKAVMATPSSNTRLIEVLIEKAAASPAP